MRLRNITLAGIILIVLAFTIGMACALENGTSNETPSVNVTGNSTETLTAPPNTTVTPDDNEIEDESLIGPGNALYGLSIAFENIGEIFTFNASEKLGKQVSHARKRIAEARAAMKRNDAEAANIALAKLEVKMSEMNGTMSELSGKDTGLINAQQMIFKHQLILENLSISHPNNKGLERAYKNNKNLEEKFRSKTARKFGRDEMEDGSVLKEEHDETEDAKERTQIKAEVTDNGSNVNIDLRFQTNNTNETDIVEETLNELKNLRINLSENLKLEHDDDTDVTGAPTTTLTASENEKDSKDYKVKLDVKAKVKENFTDVKVEFKFHLNETTKSGIVDGINKKLSELNSDEILNGLELKILEHKKVETGKEIENPGYIEKSKKAESSNIVEKKGERETRKGGSEK